MSTDAALPPSPCCGICTLDAHSICNGCGRSVQEIAEWSRADQARRIDICRRAQARLAASKPLQAGVVS